MKLVSNYPRHIYTGATTKTHIEEQNSEKNKIMRGIRKGDPISPKLFTATIENFFKNSITKTHLVSWLVNVGL